MPTKYLRLLALPLSLGLLLAACGGGDDSGSDDRASRDDDEDTTTTTEEPTTTTAAEDSGSRVGAIEDFRTDVEDDLGEEPADPTTGGTSYSGYTPVTDDSGFLTVEVPVEWADVDGAAGLFGPDVTASTDVQAFFETYNVSGVEFQATDLTTGGNPDATLDAVSQGQVNDCTPLARQDYADPLYTGRSQVFQDCAGTATDFVWLAMEPADLSFHGVVGIQITNEADLEALEHILETFIVNV